MEKFRYYNVSFSGLSLGQHEFDFHITQPFFDLFDFEQDFQKPDLNLKLILEKRNNFLELDFKLKGTVEVNCDLSNEPFDQKIKGKTKVIVKFGEDYDYTDDEVWIIPQGEHTINIAQMIYEMTLLALPLKRIHPDVESGKADSEILDLLNKYSIEEKEISNDEEIDPRWEQLRNLKNNS